MAKLLVVTQGEKDRGAYDVLISKVNDIERITIETNGFPGLSSNRIFLMIIEGYIAGDYDKILFIKNRQKDCLVLDKNELEQKFESYFNENYAANEKLKFDELKKVTHIHIVEEKMESYIIECVDDIKKIHDKNIEGLSGKLSELTHIYDPKDRLEEAMKELSIIYNNGVVRQIFDQITIESLRNHVNSNHLLSIIDSLN